jgi:acyl-[acyl-carrier-protein]-phospholipid O-acyltransferase/long-chain-fatty-acid--[acyl-carrier-protein] ligase
LTPDNETSWRRGFWSLIATQFQGAFNENALKFFVIFLALSKNPTQDQKDLWVLLIGFLFAAPFVLFSMTGGFLADRFSKRQVTIATKVFELGVMLFATLAFTRDTVTLSFAAVFLASTQAALFGPSKYGLLPELLPPKRLSWGNGVLELTTFAAIIAGAVGGPILAQRFHGNEATAGLIFAGCALAGLAASFGIAKVPAADTTRRFRLNVFGELLEQWRLVRPDRVLFLSVAGNTYFWFLGALLQFVIVFYGTEVLHIDESHSGYLQAALAIGIGIGSYAAGTLSGGKIEYGLIPLGAVGMSAAGLALALHGLSFQTVLWLLAALGFAGGFFVVPVNALIQHRPLEEKKGGVIALSAFLSFVGIGVASAIYSGGTHYLHITPPQFFFWTAILSLVATIYTLVLMPDALLRLLLWFAAHTVYRMDVQGAENIPKHGGALLVPNHGSMVDAVLVLASTERPIRFLMFKDRYEHPLIKPFVKILHVIPISSQQGPREMLRSLREATASVERGELVCIFPEGELTRIGRMLPFRRGMERIMKNVDAPIVPVNIDGTWGSIFSFSGGRFLWKWPRKLPYPVRVTFGRPMPATTTASEARVAVQALGVSAFGRRKRLMRTLPRSFIQTARRHPRRFAMADGKTPGLTFLSALAKSVFLARRLREVWRDEPMVGILLPPSVPGALVNTAALLMGKVPVNLNYTASKETLAACAAQCRLKTVISSRLFLEKVRIETPAEVVYVEDLAAAPRLLERIAALAIATCVPARWVGRCVGAERATHLDDVATVIFSSGSTGDPKGVVLTHYNVESNVEQINEVFMLVGKDRILGILPFFHSFGFTGALCMPIVAGVGVVYHPSPLESRAIGGLVSKYGVTVLIATPTFLNAYARRVAPEDFGSLRYVLAGAEKLPERIALAFEDRFGIRPMEGYGCTECSPVVSVNTVGFRAASFRQAGAKRGSIGHPLPGMAVRIVDPETRQPLPPNQPGLLLVSGPNVMQGYLNRPEKTTEVLVDGWYDTGDIAAVDEDGFIRITDRLSRFSKIGGEMVPHIKIEEKLHELAESTEQQFAVTSVPDETKGEQIVVLHTLPQDKLDGVVKKLGESGLPPLWRPRADRFVHVEALPYLGTGKLDLRRLKDLALTTFVAGS